MIAGGRGRKMPCESCAVQFSVFKRKRVCCECERYYCNGCLRRGGGAMCASCRILSTRPLYRNTIAHLKVRDLQCFLQRQNVSTRGCVEKDELVNLCVSHVNGASYRRCGARNTGAFSSLKGFTNNINDFLNSAFDLRGATPAPAPAPQQQTRRAPNSRGTNCGNCFNAMHGHRPAPPGSSAPVPPARPHSERFTTTPGGECDIAVPVPAPAPAAPDGAAAGARLESADCFEIEDLDDSVWEFVARPPAAPLPDDSDVLLTATDGTILRRDSLPHEQPADETGQSINSSQQADSRNSTGSRHSTDSDFERIPESLPRNARSTISRDYLTPGLSSGARSPSALRRAASELQLRGAASPADSAASPADSAASPADSAASPADSAASPADSASLKDELGSTPVTPKHITLEQMKSPSELDSLNVKQLKELLTRNRVEYRGCIERHELLQRAKMLWQDHAQYKDEIDNLPIEECCKICMAAPLECVLLECGHIAACTACSKQLAECPICRQYVVRAVRFFRS